MGGAINPLDRIYRIEERERLEEELSAALRERHAELRELLERVSGASGYEDPIYRFYHQSLKVFGLQERTVEVVAMLQSLLPGCPVCTEFREILAVGTGKSFTAESNANWTAHTRPIIEAFLHARFMLEMAVKFAGPKPPNHALPSGWAALLSLFQIR